MVLVYCQSIPLVFKIVLMVVVFAVDSADHGLLLLILYVVEILNLLLLLQLLIHVLLLRERFVLGLAIRIRVLIIRILYLEQRRRRRALLVILLVKEWLILTWRTDERLIDLQFVLAFALVIIVELLEIGRVNLLHVFCFWPFFM